MTTADVVDLRDVDAGHVVLVGGKGASLGELMRVGGVEVPAGVCVTTDAFRRIVASDPVVSGLVELLGTLRPDDREAIGARSAAVRRAIEATAVPADLAEAIGDAVDRLGPDAAYAVRSSATAEDLPTGSFAGQHETFLGIVGLPELLRHVSRCWASLFTERAVTYRLQRGVDERTVSMAVVLQRMLAPQAAGTLFTADPLTSNRRVASVEAVPGLGDALVAGLVEPDAYTVRDGAVVHRTVAAAPTLADPQVLQLVALGRRIEAHFGRPQDIEWCLVDGAFQIVQSRAITTSFPIPATSADGLRVYVSVGHQQMMTDPMKPLGLSMWQMKALRPMHEAGGRLFVDVTDILASPTARAGLLLLGRSDPLIGDALEAIIERADVPTRPDGDGAAAAPAAGGAQVPIDTDPAVVAELIAENEASIRALEDALRAASGTSVFDLIAADADEQTRLLRDPRSGAAVMAGLEASWWLNDHLASWLGERSAADTLSLSAPNNVTSEMGLALLDVADVIRCHPQVVDLLEHTQDEHFLDALPSRPGGRESRAAIEAFLARYGARCVGEIDITRPRWRERPLTLVPAILTDVRSFEPGAGPRRFEEGRQRALAKERDVLQRLRALPDGDAKAAETARMIERLRTFVGYREYPKYGIVRRSFVHKQALLGEVDRLVDEGVLDAVDDAFFLTFAELREVVRTRHADGELIMRRRDAFWTFEALTPPRVMTSDGEIVTGTYRRAGLPPGALVGLAVSAGVVEGRARVVVDMAAADLRPGDILVTTYTDPSWSPLFVVAAGLVTEVGGLTTHGAVVAREYGLPAVVGVEGATRRIADGQRIRVDGGAGFVELLAS